MKNTDPYSVRTQATFLLLAALFETRRHQTKSEVMAFIEQRKWFEIEAEDMKPYDSQLTEPRWKTLLAWCRKNCVSTGLMESDTRDSWAATKEGLNIVVELKNICAQGDFEVGKCFLWSNSLKTYYDPRFLPSDKDSKRSLFMYRDSFRNRLKGPKGGDFLKNLRGDEGK